MLLTLSNVKIGHREKNTQKLHCILHASASTNYLCLWRMYWKEKEEFISSDMHIKLVTDTVYRSVNW